MASKTCLFVLIASKNPICSQYFMEINGILLQTSWFIYKLRCNQVYRSWIRAWRHVKYVPCYDSLHVVKQRVATFKVARRSAWRLFNCLLFISNIYNIRKHLTIIFRKTQHLFNSVISMRNKFSRYNVSQQTTLKKHLI